MEFKDKIMLLYYFREVKCKQGFITGLDIIYNGLGVTNSTCISDLIVSELNFFVLMKKY